MTPITSLLYSRGPGLVIALCLLLISATSFAATLSISLDSPPESGVVEFQIYDSANAFAGQSNPVRKVRKDVNSSDLFVIDGLPAGEYALLVHYDTNNNKIIDKNFIGIPVEPIGFSNGYAPKGPPAFSRAAFKIKDGETRHFDVAPFLPLGTGRIGVGMGLIASSSPYRDYNGGINQFIPAISYTGERLQIFGPRLRWGLAGSGKIRVALAADYRPGAYQEKDSPFLTGMGDRDNAFMVGLALQAELPGEFDLELGYQHDILDRIGGGIARLGISKGLQLGSVRITPQVGLNYLGSAISNHDFGVPFNRATTERPAYNPGSTTSVEAGISVFLEITRDWIFLISVNAEEFSDKVVDSPLIDEDSVVKGFAAINFVF